MTEEAASRQFDTLLQKAVLNNIIIALLFASLVVTLFVINNRNNKQLSTLAFVDPVTGGYSQVRFEEEAWNKIQAARPGTYTFASLNVANFKLINDTFGTYDGDLILRNIPRERVIIESVVELAKKLSMKTVAEGVETVEQMQFLEEINCDMVQGYVISKPVDVNSFEKMVFHR